MSTIFRDELVKALGGYLEENYPDNPIHYDDFADYMAQRLDFHLRREVKMADMDEQYRIARDFKAGFIEACGWGYPVTGDVDSPAFHAARDEYMDAVLKEDEK
jgi:hypothetical protein